MNLPTSKASSKNPEPESPSGIAIAGILIKFSGTWPYARGDLHELL